MMPPKASRKKKIGRPPLKKGLKKTEGIGIRVMPELRKALEAGAELSGRSLSAEIAARLQGSLRFDSIEGRELREIANGMAANFHFAGSGAARTIAGREVPPAEWLKDRNCYDSAMQEVLLDLWRSRPNNTQESIVDFFERLKSRVIKSWWKVEGEGFLEPQKDGSK